MIKDNLVLAISSTGNKITLKNLQELLKRKDKKALANFIYDRLYGRYLKPFEYPDKHYVKHYKNGFTIMASCCLLIETYISFTSVGMKSGQSFGHFFTTVERFKVFSKGGRQKDGKLSTQKQGGVPNDFYSYVRCGILHNAETNNGWRISRDPKAPMFRETSKEINAVKFSNNLKAVLNDYRKKLIDSNFERDEIWINFRSRVFQLAENA